MPKLKIYLEKEKKYKTINAKTLDEALKKLKINPVTVIIEKNNGLITLDTKLNSKDKIKIIPVTSAG